MPNVTQQTSPFRLFTGTAAVVIILAGMKIASSFIAPILVGVFFAILIVPIYAWLRRRGAPAALAMLAIVAGVLVLGTALYLFFSAAAGQLLGTLATYQEQIAANLHQFDGLFAAMGQSSDTASNVAGGSSHLIRIMLIGIVNLLSTSIVILVVVIFTVLEAGQMRARLAAVLGDDSTLLRQATGFAHALVRYFAIRTRINLFTGTAVMLMLFLLGVDFAALWGILTFFLSYIPYVGLVLATAPSVAIAFAQGGLLKAGLVILGVAVINLSAENILAPTMLGRGLSVSPVVVFVGFLFWAWILGAPGTVLAMPLIIVVMMVLGAFDSTRWLAVLMGMPPTGFDLDSPPADQPSTPDRGPSA